LAQDTESYRYLLLTVESYIEHKKQIININYINKKNRLENSIRFSFYNL